MDVHFPAGLSDVGHTRSERLTMPETAHAPAGLRIMYVIWGWLLAITLVEVFLAYEQFPLMVMLLALLGLSIMKAGMIMSWFMHLKFERVNLVLTIIPAMIMCMI